MKAYLINPFAQTITEVDYSGDYNEIYQLINCDTFTCVELNEYGDTVFIDDEGLISGKPQEFFVLRDYPQPLAGMGLVLGTDQEGESKSPFATLEAVRNWVTFMPAFMVRAIYS